MIALKWIGAVCMMAAGLWTALVMIGRERKRLTVLEAWIELIDHIRTEIDLYLTPLDEALQSAEPTLFKKLGVDSNAPIELDTLVKKSEPFWERESRRAIQTLVRELGASYREQQIKQCELQRSILERVREAVAAQLPQKTRLYTTLCLCTAAGLLILLW